MAVPEAAVNENNAIEFFENHIGPTRKVFAVQAETEASRVEVLSKQDFRLGIFALYAGHHSGSDFRTYDVHHQIRPADC